MKSCVFCDVIKGSNSQSARIIRRSADFVAMLALHPQTKGHFIVIPKKHMIDIPSLGSSLPTLMKQSVLWAEEIVPKLGTNAYVLRINNKLYILEQEEKHVPHVHMHVTPRYGKTDSLELADKPAEDSYFDAIKKLL